MKQITSRTNPQVKMWRSLLQAKGIRRNGRAIVSGARIVNDVLNERPAIVQACLISESCTDIPNIIPTFVETYILSDALFHELDIFGTRYPLLVVSVAHPAPFDPEKLNAPMTLIVPFQDPSNVGAVVRSATAFNVFDIILTKEAAFPYHPKSLRASGGYVFSASFRIGPALSDMPKFDIPVYGLSSIGTPISEVTFSSPSILVPGIEGPGLPLLPWITHHVAIPMSPVVESLNAAVATSIALYEFNRTITSNK